MKTKQCELTDAQRKHLDRIYEDLGPDLMKKLHKAFTLTAAAFHKRAKQRAEAEMQLADQYRSLEEEAEQTGKP
jgi:hypothetical protein